MSRYRDFVLKHIDKIDRSDSEQRREFFTLVRSSAERQIRSHYKDEAELADELQALDAAIAAIDAECVAAALSKQAGQSPRFVSPAPPATEPVLEPPEPAVRPRMLFSRSNLLIALAALTLGFAYWGGFFSTCPALTCHDSGWVRARNTDPTPLVIPHTLGNVPRHISLWYSRTGNEDAAQPILWSGASATANPVDIQVSPTETKLFITPERPLHSLYNVQHGWLAQETGFFRVIVRK